MSRTLLCCCVVALATAHAASAPPSISGHWEGSLQRGGEHLDVSFDFPSAEPAHGYFSAPDLGAIDIPLANVKQDGALHWDLVGDHSTMSFDAALHGDAVAGSIQEGALAGRFELHRASLSTDKPYTVEKVTFRDGDVVLAGSVYAPREPGRHPALIFVHGSGAEGRWASAGLADFVARRGVVALIYDKAGVGESGGNWQTATLEDLAADARAGVDLLAHRTDVDTSRVGVYGHSQGAQIAPLIAANDEQVHWIIAADGPVGPEYLQDLFRVDNLLAAHYQGAQLHEAERVYAEFVDTARNRTSHAPLRADIARAGKAAWVDDLAIPDDGDPIWDWYARVGNFDNRAAWAKVQVPVLLLFGAHDMLVPAQDSITQTTAILAAHGNARVTSRVFPGADHSLRIPAATANGWPHLAPGFPDVIVDFASGHAPS